MKLPISWGVPISPVSTPRLGELLTGLPTPSMVSARRTGTSLPAGLERTLNEVLGRAGLMNRTPPAWPTFVDGRLDVQQATVAAGTFVTRSFSNSAGARDYKLYVPRTHAGQVELMPLVVMLHGCTQSADDFAVGTRMNHLAEERGFLVAYPEQPARANGSRCWNWFSPKDQQRDGGEPSLIAGITREVISGFRVDPHRVFIAGLSAGAAMAVLLGATYPELYAAVGAHSGLPSGAAKDVSSALKAMSQVSKRESVGTDIQRTGVSTIVFHGDADSTVAVGNGLAISADAVRAISRTSPLTRSSLSGRSRQGQEYSLTIYADVEGVPRVETWILHGAGHVWSGGNPAGTYTDAAGVDATGEMIRFFLARNF